MKTAMLPPPPANASALRLLAASASTTKRGSTIDALYAAAAGHSLRRFSDFGPSIEMLAEAALTCGD